MHTRKDFRYIILRGKPHFSRAAYACVITQETTHGRAIYHIETFYGSNARTVRAAASRFGRTICSGQSLPGLRTFHLPHNFPSCPFPSEREIGAKIFPSPKLSA